MKRELTLTDIAGYLPYGLKLLDRKYGMTTVWEWQSAACCDWNGEEKVEMISGEKYSEELVMASPILRPMSDLYVEITDKDYNGGEPFVPVVELAKARHPNFDQYIFHPTEQLVFCSIDGDFDNYTECYDYYEDRLSIAELDLLHRLRFDIRGLIDAGLAVSVHDLKRNPYEAANN